MAKHQNPQLIVSEVQQEHDTDRLTYMVLQDIVDSFGDRENRAIQDYVLEKLDEIMHKLRQIPQTPLGNQKEAFKEIRKLIRRKKRYYITPNMVVTAWKLLRRRRFSLNSLVSLIFDALTNAEAKCNIGTPTQLEAQFIKAFGERSEAAYHLS